MSLSIVMTARKRASQLMNTLESINFQTVKPNQIVIVEDGVEGWNETQDVCRKWRGELPIDLVLRRNRPKLGYSNPAIPKNIGIRKATGELLIIQCGEVRYTRETDIENLIRPVAEDHLLSTFAYCKALAPNGEFQEWYAGPERSAGWFLDFCQCASRAAITAIGGFDEQYQGYGFDDDDFAFRMQQFGVKYQWAPEVITEHQWHSIPDKNVELSEAGRTRLGILRKRVLEEGRADLVIANVGMPWGDPNS